MYTNKLQGATLGVKAKGFVLASFSEGFLSEDHSLNGFFCELQAILG